MKTKRTWLWLSLAAVGLFGMAGVLLGLGWMLGRMMRPAEPQNPALPATWAAATLQALAPPTTQTIETPVTEAPTAVPPTFAPASPSATGTATLPPSPTIAPTATPIPSPTPQCLVAGFVKDVTVPDGTVYSPGKPFAKTWRLRNEGACTWTTGFSVYFDRGDAMGGPPSVNLPHAVEPGETVDVTVEFQAPDEPGTYKGYWKVRSDDGRSFGIGNEADEAFWVAIRVELPLLSLFDRAPDATWVSGAGVLPYGGATDDDRGFVRDMSGQVLEDGSAPAKVLETHPQWVDDGAISGRYPAFTLYAGHRFRARLGFLAKGDGSCGVGDVIFQLNYRDDTGLHPLGQWHETCDGSLRDVEVDLSGLAGKSVELVLAVMANGSSAQDWAVWVDPRVVGP